MSHGERSFCTKTYRKRLQVDQEPQEGRSKQETKEIKNRHMEEAPVSRKSGRSRTTRVDQKSLEIGHADLHAYQQHLEQPSRSRATRKWSRNAETAERTKSGRSRPPEVDQEPLEGDQSALNIKNMRYNNEFQETKKVDQEPFSYHILVILV